MGTKATDVYEKVTNQIVARIEQGENGTWHAPWHHDANHVSTQIPANAKTHKPYRGSNILVLWITAEINGYSTGVWGTYNQWTDLGAQVRKGEKATHCVKWVFPDEKRIAKAKAEGKRKPGPFPSTFALFNAAEVDGYTPPEPVDTGITPIDEAEAFFAAIEADVRYGGNKAFYATVGDYIQAPPITQFDGADRFYSVLAHEHTHWTGHKSRNDRDFSSSTRFGDSSYAFEELVAELGAAFITAQLGLANEPREDHAEYLSHWLGVLKADPQALFTAASQAQKAVDFLSAAVGLDTEPADEEMVSA